jgi:hypothetical protein
MTPDIAIPAPEIAIPSIAELPAPIQDAIERLSRPFAIEEVKVRPGAVTRDGSAALALAYLDWWTGYLPRLNDEVGPNNWTITLRPWGEHQIVARLTAFGGQIVSESSGSAKGEANGAAEAEAQAKKRVCAEGLMLGLYLYFLPKVWGKGEKIGKEFVFAEGEERRCVYDMYARVGLLTRTSPGIEIARPASPSTSAAAPTTERTTTARAALANAERRVGLNYHDTPTPAATTHKETTTAIGASDKQLGLIVRLLSEHNAGAISDEAIDAIGERFGIPHLSDIRTRAQLRSRAASLTILNASRLIDALKALHADLIDRAA